MTSKNTSKKMGAIARKVALAKGASAELADKLASAAEAANVVDHVAIQAAVEEASDERLVAGAAAVESRKARKGSGKVVAGQATRDHLTKAERKAIAERKAAEQAAAEEQARAEAEAKAAELAKEQAKIEAEQKMADEALKDVVSQIVAIEEDVHESRVRRADLLFAAKTQYLDTVNRIYGSWQEFCNEAINMHVGSVSNILKVRSHEVVWGAYTDGTLGDWAAQTLAKSNLPDDVIADVIAKRRDGYFVNDSGVVTRIKDLKAEQKREAERKNAPVLTPLEEAEAKVKKLRGLIEDCQKELAGYKAELKEAQKLVKELQADDLEQLGLSKRQLTALAQVHVFTADDVRKYVKENDLVYIRGIGPASAQQIMDVCNC